MRQLANPHHHVLTPQQAEDFGDLLRVIANPHRLRILSLILHAPGGLTTVQLLGHVRLSQPAVSHHMKALAEAGLVRRRAQMLPYTVVPGALDYVASFLAGGR